MIRTIINLASNFKLDVIAEGVETDNQLSFLRQFGCNAYQGYLFGKPVPFDEFENLLTNTVNRPPFNRHVNSDSNACLIGQHECPQPNSGLKAWPEHEM